MSPEIEAAVAALRTTWTTYRDCCFARAGRAWIWASASLFEFGPMVIPIRSIPGFKVQFRDLVVEITVFAEKHIVPLALMESESLGHLTQMLRGEQHRQAATLKAAVTAFCVEFDARQTDEVAPAAASMH